MGEYLPGQMPNQRQQSVERRQGTAGAPATSTTVIQRVTNVTSGGSGDPVAIAKANAAQASADAVTAEVVAARDTYSTLADRLDNLGGVTDIPRTLTIDGGVF